MWSQLYSINVLVSPKLLFDISKILQFIHLHDSGASVWKTYQLAVLWTEQSCFQSQIQNCFQLAQCTCRTHTPPTSPGCKRFHLLQSWQWYLELQMFLVLRWSGTGRLGSESWGSLFGGPATPGIRWHHQIPELGDLLVLVEGLCTYKRYNTGLRDLSAGTVFV